MSSRAHTLFRDTVADMAERTAEVEVEVEVDMALRREHHRGTAAEAQGPVVSHLHLLARLLAQTLSELLRFPLYQA